MLCTSKFMFQTLSARGRFHPFYCLNNPYRHWTSMLTIICRKLLIFRNWWIVNVFITMTYPTRSSLIYSLQFFSKKKWQKKIKIYVVKLITKSKSFCLIVYNKWNILLLIQKLAYKDIGSAVTNSQIQYRRVPLRLSSDTSQKRIDRCC